MSSILKEFDGLHAGVLELVVSNSICKGFRDPDLTGVKGYEKMKDIIETHLIDLDKVSGKLILASSKMTEFEEGKKMYHLIKMVKGIALDVRYKLVELKKSKDDANKFYAIAQSYYAGLEGYCQRIENKYGPTDIPTLAQKIEATRAKYRESEKEKKQDPEILYPVLHDSGASDDSGDVTIVYKD